MPLPISIAVKRLPHGLGLDLPAYQTDHAAGMDLLAALTEDQPLLLAPLERAACPCGFAMALPEGYEAQVRPRSGMAIKHGLSVPNAPGTIDADYRGEVKVLLVNLGREPIVITRGMRIAQMVIARVEKARWIETDELPDSARGAGGFGSTGT
ncbi:MAG TPA: dUTP diphosphatase [Phycisphaerae bacterium]|nr:dUTP diphosphatase [Phycisphaerae bacterium]